MSVLHQLSCTKRVSLPAFLLPQMLFVLLIRYSVNVGLHGSDWCTVRGCYTPLANSWYFYWTPVFSYSLLF